MYPKFPGHFCTLSNFASRILFFCGGYEGRWEPRSNGHWEESAVARWTHISVQLIAARRSRTTFRQILWQTPACPNLFLMMRSTSCWVRRSTSPKWWVSCLSKLECWGRLFVGLLGVLADGVIKQETKNRLSRLDSIRMWILRYINFGYWIQYRCTSVWTFCCFVRD